jgi:hypothetical protein
VPEKPPKLRRKYMKKDKLELEDDLRPEYDLNSLKVRKMGSGRKNFAGTTVRLEPDVAEMFPNAVDKILLSF